MPIIYRGSTAIPLSHSIMDSNFDYLNNVKASISSMSGAAIIPVATSINSIYPQNFFYNSATDLFNYYLTIGGTRTQKSIPQRGYVGSAGELIGSAGYIGLPGATGPTGDTGATGPTGTNGLAGNSGITGPTGYNGAISVTYGPVGYQGSTGSSGAVGNTGAVGATGTYTNPPQNTTYVLANTNNTNTFWYSSGTATPGLDSYGVAVSNTPNVFAASLSSTPPLILDRTSAGYNLICTRSNLTSGHFTVLTSYMSSTVMNIRSGDGVSNNIVYNTTSDYRAKKNIVEKTSGELEKINKIQTYSYNKLPNAEDSDNDATLKYGVLAHELAEIYPEYVTGKKDAMNEDNTPAYQSVDYIALIPHITLALKELAEEIDALEAEINMI